MDDNDRLDSGHLKEDWLYREMKYTRIQMESGVPEIQAYLEFGQRMELQQYKKFSQLLIQYIKRHDGKYRQEAAEAEKQRRDLAKQLGETAGTKLLMPMMLLLIIVLLIVMVPAFLSM